MIWRIVLWISGFYVGYRMIFSSMGIIILSLPISILLLIIFIHQRKSEISLHGRRVIADTATVIEKLGTNITIAERRRIYRALGKLTEIDAIKGIDNETYHLALSDLNATVELIMDKLYKNKGID